MKRIPSWLTYTVLRLVLVFVPFGVLMALGLPWLTAIFLATVLSFLLSLVLLRRPREATSIALAQASDRRAQAAPSADDAREDAEVAEVLGDEDEPSNRG